MEAREGGREGGTEGGWLGRVVQKGQFDEVACLDYTKKLSSVILCVVVKLLLLLPFTVEGRVRVMSPIVDRGENSSIDQVVCGVCAEHHRQAACSAPLG